MHPRRRGDGLTLPALAIPVAQMVVRTFDMGHGVAAKDRQLADESPVLAVLTTVGDRPRDWLAAGQALQRLLLLGVQFGLQASYLNQPVQVATLRPKLQQLSGCPGYAQLLLRIGTPTQVKPAAPRRPLADVLTGTNGLADFRKAMASRRGCWAVTARRAQCLVQPGGLCDRRACIHGNTEKASCPASPTWCGSCA